jgi:hypothetical protein
LTLDLTFDLTLDPWPLTPIPVLTSFGSSCQHRGMFPQQTVMFVVFLLLVRRRRRDRLTHLGCPMDQVQSQVWTFNKQVKTQTLDNNFLTFA